MNNAMDCAFLGKPLEECSPDLITTDFKQDVIDAQEEFEEIQKELLLLQEELEASQEQAN